VISALLAFIFDFLFSLPFGYLMTVSTLTIPDETKPNVFKLISVARRSPPKEGEKESRYIAQLHLGATAALLYAVRIAEPTGRNEIFRINIYTYKLSLYP